MNLFDLARYLWPDGFEGRQPQGASVRAEISGVPASFLLLPSISVDDLAGNAAKTVAGAMGRTSSGVMAGKSILVTDNTNRIKWAKRTNRTKFTAVYYGYLSAPSTASSCHVFGQFQPNSSVGDATVYDWSIYESWATDFVTFQISNGTTSAAAGPGTGVPWVAFKPRCVAVSFDKGVAKVSVDGGPVATTTVAVTTMSANWDIASGGYWGAQSAYNPGLRTALAATFDSYAAHDAELRSLSGNPWQMFVSPVDVGWPVPASVGGSYGLSAVGVAVADGSAAPAVSVPLSAAGISVSGGSANAVATITISAAGLAQAAGQAGLSASVLLAGAGAAQASGNAGLAAQIEAMAAGAAQASGTANLSGGAPGALSAAGQAQAAGSAVLSVNVSLAATGAGQSSGTANGAASAPGALNAAGAAQAGGNATWSALVTLTAAGFVQAMGAGQLSMTVPLSATGAAQAGGAAQAALLGETRHYRLSASAARVTRASCGTQRTTTLHHEVRHA